MHLVGLALSLALAAPLPPPVPLAELVSRMAVAEGEGDGVDPDGSPVVFVGVRYVGLAANAATTTPVTTVAAWENIDRANPNWRLAVLDEALSRRFEQDDLAVPPKAKPKPKATLSGGAISLEPQAPIDGRDLLVVADARVPFWKVQRVLYAAESLGARVTIGLSDGKRLRRGPVLERRAGPTPCLPLTLLELPFGTAVEFGTTAVAGPTGACIAGDDHADVVRATLKAAGKKLCVGAKAFVDDEAPWQRIADDARVLSQHGLSVVLMSPPDFGLPLPPRASSCVPLAAALTAGGEVRGLGWPAPVKATIVFDGALSKDEIRAVVTASLPAIRQCYDAELAKDATLEGTLTMSWTIGPNGSTSNARAAQNTFGTKGGATVETCVRGVVAKMRFPHPVGGGNVQVTAYPLVFANSSGGL